MAEQDVFRGTPEGEEVRRLTRDWLMADFGVPTHPLADRMTAPKWNVVGGCICGEEIPPMMQWANAGSDWASHECSGCGRGFVDEGDYIAVYDDGLGDE